MKQKTSKLRGGGTTTPPKSDVRYEKGLLQTAYKKVNSKH